MSMTLSGSGTVTGLTPGGLPDASVATTDIVDGAVSQLKLGANVAGNGPAFSAYGNGVQAIALNTWTKVALQNEIFDTNNNFDSAANYRFTPTVAGYYQINGGVTYNAGVSGGAALCSIYKNGGESIRGNGVPFVTSDAQCRTVSGLVYLNGSTDYVELYTYQSNGTINTASASANTIYFQASMVRSA